MVAGVTPLPSIGRIVHVYRGFDPVPSAAIVTGVHSDLLTISATVFPDGDDVIPLRGVAFGDNGASRTGDTHWAWPPKT